MSAVFILSGPLLSCCRGITAECTIVAFRAKLTDEPVEPGFLLLTF